jgi:hypothetical protein
VDLVPGVPRETGAPEEARSTLWISYLVFHVKQARPRRPLDCVDLVPGVPRETGPRIYLCA